MAEHPLDEFSSAELEILCHAVDNDATEGLDALKELRGADHVEDALRLLRATPERALGFRRG